MLKMDAGFHAADAPDFMSYRNSTRHVRSVGCLLNECPFADVQMENVNYEIISDCSVCKSSYAHTELARLPVSQSDAADGNFCDTCVMSRFNDGYSTRAPKGQRRPEF